MAPSKKSPAKKAPVKKSIKKATAAKAAPVTRAAATAPVGIPCICIKKRGRWFCMKDEDGALVECDGPFSSREECEEHTCM